MTNIALVQNAGSSGAFNVTSRAQTWATPPTAGNLVVVPVAIANGGTASSLDWGASAVVDNHGNTFSRAVQSGRFITGGNSGNVAIYYLVVPSTYASYIVTATPTIGTATFPAILIGGIEYSGQNATPLDVTASSGNSTAVSPFLSGTTATTAADCQLLVAQASAIDGSFLWDADPAGWTQRWKDGGASVLPAEVRDNISSTANHGIAASTTWTVSSGTIHQYCAVIATFRAASATTLTFEGDGTITPSGTLVKETDKSKAGSITPSGALVRQDNLIRGGTLTPAGSLSSSGSNILSGTLTPAGALNKQIDKSFGGTETPSGVLSRLVGLIFGGSVTPSGSLTTTITSTTADRVTQEAVEAQVAVTANERVTQEVVEVQVDLGGATNARVTQETVETMVALAVVERVTQVVVETMVSFVPPLPPPVTTVCTTPTRAWINLYNTSGTLMAVFDDWKTLDIQHTLNSYSVCTLTLDAADLRIPSFALDGLVEVVRQVGGTTTYREYVGFHRAMRTELTSDQHAIFTSISRGLLDLLKRRFIYYQAVTAYTLKSDKVDVVIQQIVNENAGPGALSPPRYTNGVTPGLAVPLAPGLGPTWAGKLDNENVLETLNKIVPLTNVDFDVVLTALTPSPTFEFRTYWPQRGADRSAYLAFDPLLGNAIVPVYALDNSEEINVVAVLGPGQDSSRRVFPMQGTDLTSSPWNIVEGTENASSEQTLEGMQSAGQAKLDANIPKESFTFDVLQQDTAMYGRDYAVGDVVTARYGSISRKVKIVSATVSIAQGKETVSLRFSELPV